MYELDIRENFKKELIGLILKLEDRIKILSEKISFEESDPSRLQSSRLNRLKLHRYKLKEILDWMNDIYIADWIRNKVSFQKEFQDAVKVLL